MGDQLAEEYVDSHNNVSHPCRSTDSECRDYLQIYYGEDYSQSRILCREELANFETVLGVTSFIAVYWSDSTNGVNVSSSFHLRVECVRYTV